MKQHGRMKISSIHAIWTLSCRSEGTCDCSLSLLDLLLSNLGARFIVRGEGCDTPSVTVAIVM
jgi:hypothetical protein